MAAYNIAKALTTLGGNKVILGGEVGNDLLGKVVIDEINKLGIDASSVDTKLEQTPTSAIFVDRDCNTKIYNDLKDLQDVKKDVKKEIKNLKASDLVVLSNTNFNREILLKAKELGKKVASDRLRQAGLTGWDVRLLDCDADGARVDFTE